MKVPIKPKASLTSLAKLNNKRMQVRAKLLQTVKTMMMRRAAKLRKRNKMSQKIYPLLRFETPRNQVNHPTLARKAATLSL